MRLRAALVLLGLLLVAAAFGQDRCVGGSLILSSVYCRYGVHKGKVEAFDCRIVKGKTLDDTVNELWGLYSEAMAEQDDSDN
jgi:hypothetical protein